MNTFPNILALTAMIILSGCTNPHSVHGNNTSKAAAAQSSANDKINKKTIDDHCVNSGFKTHLQKQVFTGDIVELTITAYPLWSGESSPPNASEMRDKKLQNRCRLFNSFNLPAQMCDNAELNAVWVEHVGEEAPSTFQSKEVAIYSPTGSITTLIPRFQRNIKIRKGNNSHHSVSVSIFDRDKLSTDTSEDIKNFVSQVSSYQVSKGVLQQEKIPLIDDLWSLITYIPDLFLRNDYIGEMSLLINSNENNIQFKTGCLLNNYVAFDIDAAEYFDNFSIRPDTNPTELTLGSNTYYSVIGDLANIVVSASDPTVASVNYNNKSGIITVKGLKNGQFHLVVRNAKNQLITKDLTISDQNTSKLFAEVADE